MTRGLVRALVAAAGAVVALLAAAGSGVWICCLRYDASVARVYHVPAPAVVRSSDPAVLARGKHLVESIGSCAIAVCHGADLGGGLALEMGPLGTVAAPNITPAGQVRDYTDGELVRLIRQGLKKDGRSVALMPAQAFGWLPESDVVALVSYLRTVPSVDRPDRGRGMPFPLKLLDRIYDAPVDVARRIDRAAVQAVPPVAPTAEYGAFVARACRECHGQHLSGGRIPGLPASMTTPLNLTPDATGLQGWSSEDFDRTLKTGVRKGGATLSPVMPIDSFRNFDDIEMRALWAYLSGLPATPFGGR